MYTPSLGKVHRYQTFTRRMNLIKWDPFCLYSVQRLKVERSQMDF